MRRCFRLLSFLMLVFPFTGKAQISAPLAVLAESTDYREGAVNDVIYTFISQTGGLPSGSLQAQAPGDADSCTFTWTRFNPSTHLFDIPYYSDENVSSSAISSLAQGGYQVHVFRSGITDTLFRAWVYNHSISVDVLETSDGLVPDNKFTCEYVELNASLGYDTLFYANPATGTARSYFIRPTVNWDYSNDKENVSGAFTGTYVRCYNPPAYDTRYVAIAGDRTGLHREDSVLYETIQTEASFSFKVKDRGESIFREPAGEESSPLEVEFINTSVNGVQFKWVFTDTLFGKQKKEVPLITTDTTDRPHYIYYYPHSYVVTLYSYSPQGCIDSANNTEEIKIKKSKLDVPNFFCIDQHKAFDINRRDENGTLMNSEFFATIKSFHITIFSRQGRKVYEFEGDINTWEGWNGRVGGLDLYGADGVYFYVIEATGYDGVVYKGETKTKSSTNEVSSVYYTGFLYLFRECPSSSQ